jgi:hypothetical protein
MERNLKEIFLEAAYLPERDRATLAGLLIESFTSFLNQMLKTSWSEEIKIGH